MAPRQYAARVDENQAEIVEALRAVGAQVQTLHRLGSGCPDLLVAFRGMWYVGEVKAYGGRLTQDEIDWHRKFGQVAPVFIWYDVNDALKDIGAIDELERRWSFGRMGKA